MPRNVPFSVDNFGRGDFEAKGAQVSPALARDHVEKARFDAIMDEAFDLALADEELTGQ